MERLRPKAPEFQPIRLTVEALTKELATRGFTIAIAEGCSGGALLDALTIPGATRIFHVGGIFCSRKSIIELGVQEETINTHGKYSLKTAIEMAESIRRIRGDTLGIATVGNMNPLNPQKTRPVFLGLSMQNKKPWGKSIILKPDSRKLMKEQLTRVGFASTLFYLLGQKDSEVERDILSFDRICLISPELFELSQKAESLINNFRNRGLTVATVESCTGGAIANAITDIRGASQVLKKGWVLYDEDVKKEKSGVSFETMRWGVYTEKVALGMAKGVSQRTDVDVVIATTGVMDTIDTRPYHNDTSPGTVFIAAVHRGKKPLASRLSLEPRSREEMKVEVASKALDLALLSLAQPKQNLFYPSGSLNDFIFIKQRE